MPIDSKTPPKEKSKTKAKPAAEPEGAWRLGEDGRKERSSRALTHEIKLREFFLGVAGTVRIVGKDEFTANAIVAKHEELAYGYAKWAKEDPAVNAVLNKIFSASAMMDALLPTVMLGVVVLWHYEILVPDNIGAPLALANGLLPISKEQEAEHKRRAAAEQAAKENGNGE